MATAIHAINAALVEGGAEEVLAVLKEPMLTIRSITDECAATYQTKLLEATEEKAQKGNNLCIVCVLVWMHVVCVVFIIIIHI